MMINFGKTVINNAAIGFKGMDALIWQRKFKKGLLSSGQLFKFYYNTTVSNGNNLFEIEIWQDGSKITTTGQLLHAKNTRRCCDMVAVFDPNSEYIIKVYSKSSVASTYLQSIQIKDYDTEIDASGVEQISYLEKKSDSMTGNGTSLKSKSISFKTYVDTPHILVQQGSSYLNAGVSSANTTSANIYLNNINGSNWSTSESFVCIIRGPLVSPVLL